MTKIKPLALLVCGILANSPNNDWTMTASSIGHYMMSKISTVDLMCLLNDMVSAGMITKHIHEGYADAYTLNTFEAEIGIK